MKGMFGRKAQDERVAKGKKNKDEAPEGAPSVALDAKAIKARFMNAGALEVERNRYFVAILAMCAVAGLLAFSIASLTPLKEVTPYVIETDNIGRTEVSNARAIEFTPSEIQLRYFLAEWTNQMMTIRPGVTSQNLPKAFNKTRGTASSQFREHLDSYDPIGRSTDSPEVTVDTQIRSINFLSDGAAVIQFYTETRSPNRATGREDYSLVVNYETFRPQTEEQILENPVGLVVTNFNLTRDIGG
ncbi:type IV secretion system protein [Thioalkalivibrio sp. ALE16]|uniref:type IV secretion system protein n=1 Tax=Thioalkalivibrio sp. ALE16 TaxID=1158172 RepID=UPI000372F22C|nr:type IV secretion system protein [Thioalkalivibrio sp. ALE16]